MNKNIVLLVMGLLLITVIVHGANVSKVRNAILAFHTPYQCPLTLQFRAEITTEGPSDVKYQWVRSDGFRTPEILLHFDRAETKTVRYSWTLRVYNPVLRTQWTQVQILSPNNLLSNRAGASVHCRPR